MATLAEARRRACKLWPYGCHAILSLVPVESQRVKTMSVDRHWRLYYSPGYLDALSSDEAAITILHEVSHLLLKHHKRATRFVPAQASEAEWFRWNVAADLAVNHNLAEEGLAIADAWLMAERLGFEGGLSA